MKKIKYFSVLMAVVFAVPVLAAIPQSQQGQSPRELVIMALRLPLKNRTNSIRIQGKRAFEALQDLAFDPTQPLFIRWRAITTIGNVFPEKAYPVLEKALVDSRWFLRNAAILALPSVSKSDAIKWSVKLLDDRALVVRTAAVQTLTKLKAKTAEPILWEKLKSSENYYRGKSLWVRKHIARALGELASSSSLIKFIHLLKDSDERVQKQAILGLERLTGKKLSRRSAPVAEQKVAWENWWSRR